MKMNYNFNKLQIAMGDLKEKPHKSQALKDIKNELNKFFKDSKCDGVIYTENDKFFFGMCVLPVLDRSQTVALFSNKGKPQRFDKYIVEIDSQLLNPILNVSDVELVAAILHEVGHVVNNTIASQKISDQINYYIGKEGVRIDYAQVLKNDSMINIGIFRSLRKLTSLFEKEDEEYIADQFVVDCGFGPELESLYDKVIKNRDRVSRLSSDENKFISLIWSLALYKEMNTRYKTVRQQLEDAQLGESSNLFKNLYSKVLRGMNDMVYQNSLEQIVVSESMDMIKENFIIRSLRSRKMKEIEDELYEYSIRIKMIESNSEALDILKSLNMRINMIQDYIDKSNLNEPDFERYTSIMNKYDELRTRLIEKDTFDPQQHGLYVKYPKIHV